MKSALKDQAAKTLVVNPSARRCGVDDQPEEKSAKLESLVDQVRNSEEFAAVSDRLLNFANLVDQELATLRDATEQKNAATMEKGAQRVANLASEIGASDLIRSCYQLLITLRQGDCDAAVKLVPQVEQDYKTLKSSLRLA